MRAGARNHKKQFQTMTPRSESIRNLLHISPIFQQLVRSRMLEKHFKRGEVIADDAILRGNAFWLLSGMARGFYTRKGVDRTYSFAFEGDFIGVPMSLFRLPDATPAIEFLEATDILMIPRSDFSTDMKMVDDATFREIAENIMLVLFEHMQLIEEQMYIFQSLNARERYEWFVGRYPVVLERATITQIASFLGVTKETLYRIRAGKYGGNAGNDTSKQIPASGISKKRKDNKQ